MTTGAQPPVVLVVPPLPFASAAHSGRVVRILPSWLPLSSFPAASMPLENGSEKLLSWLPSFVAAFWNAAGGRVGSLLATVFSAASLAPDPAMPARIDAWILAPFVMAGAPAALSACP